MTVGKHLFSDSLRCYWPRAKWRLVTQLLGLPCLGEGEGRGGIDRSMGAAGRTARRRGHSESPRRWAWCRSCVLSVEDHAGMV